MNYVQEYIDKINSGEIKTSKKVLKLYNNIIQPILDGSNPKYYFDEKKGERPIRFMESFCKQSKGEWAGKKTELILFQKAKLQALFGILRTDTGFRRFKELFDVRGRKNGKSTEQAGVGDYLLIDKEELGGEIYVAATVASQARRVWEESDSMVSMSPDLQSVIKRKVFPVPMLYCPRTGTQFKTLSKNVKTFDGLNCSAAIIDEAHELGRKIYDILKQAMSAKKQPLMSIITTAGFVRGGLFDDLYDYSSQVLDGIVEDDELFPLIYELDDPSEIDDESCWIKANPALDVIKKRESLRYNVQRMKTDLNFANTVKVKDFNIIGVENKAWLPYDVFNNAEVYSDEDLKKFDNTAVLGGYDLSRTGDMTAFTTLLFDREKRKIIAVTMYWITAKFLQKQIEMNGSKGVPWMAWIDRGLVRISGTNTIDYHDVANYVASCFQQRGWMYQHIDYDSYSAQYLVEELASLGYSKSSCQVPIVQGFKTLSIPMQTLEAHLRDKILVYQNNPVTKWCFSNGELVTDRNGNYMLKKCDDIRGRKIDGVATILDCYVSLCENITYYLD
jgi:phage terminase large subunit-like protein